MTTLGRGKSVRGTVRKKVSTGVACPSDAKPGPPGAAGNTWTNTG
jgi:hypothetical protein